MSVLVVTDNEIERFGVESAMSAVGVDAVGWDPKEWGTGSQLPDQPWRVVLVDVTPAPSGWDRLVAVSWLQRLAATLPPEVALVCWSGTAISVPAALRLARAGATDVVELPRRLTVEDVLSFRDRSYDGIDPMPSSCDLAALGLSRSSDPEAGLGLVVATGMAEAFEPGFRVSSGVARRASMNLRKRFARDVGLRTSMERFSVMDDRDLSVPTWAEVARIVNMTRGLGAARWSGEDDLETVGDRGFDVASAS